VATPLIAPCQSEVDVIQAPSTQLPVWTTVSAIECVEKLADSKDPVQVPDMSAKGPPGAVGPPEDGVDEPHAAPTPASTSAQRTSMRLRTNGQQPTTNV
jgi:hypothetical protein